MQFKMLNTINGETLQLQNSQSMHEKDMLRETTLSEVEKTVHLTESESLKICLVINGFHNGGIERVLENYFSHMDRMGLDIHIISHLEPNEEIEKKFRDMGATIHYFSFYHARSIKPKNMKEYDEFFKNNRFDIVHNNVAINILPLFYAKKHGVPVRILHSHADYKTAFKEKNKFIRAAYEYVIKKNVRLATHYFACGIRPLAAFARRG